MKHCITCGKKFTPGHNGQEVCSAKCLVAVWDAFPRTKRTKANARRVAHTLGFRSFGEVRFAASLDLCKVVYDYEPEKFSYNPPKRTYTPDFRIKHRKKNGCMYIEYKGNFTGVDRNKILMVKRDNPGIDLRIIFERATNKLNRASSTTYSMWCDKNGIPWAEKELPEQWRKE